MGQVKNGEWIVEHGDMLFVYRKPENQIVQGYPEIENDYMVFDPDSKFEIPKNGVFYSHRRMSPTELVGLADREVQVEDWTYRYSKNPCGYIGILKVRGNKLIVIPKSRPEEERSEPVQLDQSIEVGPIEIPQGLDLKRD